MFATTVVCGIRLKLKSSRGAGKLITALKKEQKIQFSQYFCMFPAEKPHFLYRNIDCYCINIYGEIIGLSLTFITV